MTSRTSSGITRDAVRADGPTRFTTSIGIAILAVSAAGLVHAWLGLAWTTEVQVAYSAVAGLVAWRRTR